MNEPNLSCVVIAFNEALCLNTVVRELVAALDRAAIGFELVLVDDGSRDQTLERMRELAAWDARIQVVPLPENRGIGGALRAGFDAARGRFVTWVPADGQIGPDVVTNLYAQRARAPMLTTVYVARADAWYRHVISGSLNRLIEWRTGAAAKSGGNYLFERGLWLAHAPAPDDSMLLSTAFRARLREANVPILEVEIAARARVAGHSKVLNPRTIARTLWSLLKLPGTGL
ncbi:MAG TPA: glycosyltransferase family 2 protein [Polyangiales bacterium]|nr:glycosyltransferase family 2 protein [Polyangiales bacterium]